MPKEISNIFQTEESTFFAVTIIALRHGLQLIMYWNARTRCVINWMPKRHVSCNFRGMPLALPPLFPTTSHPKSLCDRVRTFVGLFNAMFVAPTNMPRLLTMSFVSGKYAACLLHPILHPVVTRHGKSAVRGNFVLSRTIKHITPDCMTWFNYLTSWIFGKVKRTNLFCSLLDIRFA